MPDVICDLDGVLYQEHTPVPDAGQALSRLIAAGLSVTFVTNNSTRSPASTAAKIEEMTGVEVDASAVVTSSAVASSMIRGGDQPVLVVGEAGVTDVLESAGITMTASWEEAHSVVVGMYRNITYQDIADAAGAVRAGARFIATNNDPTYPTPGRLLPGAGSMVAAIATAAGVAPEVAGKPHRPMRDLLITRGIGDAWVIGDRLDTDVALAALDPRWTSILVMTGVTKPHDDIALADHVVDDFAAAVDLVLSGER